MCCTPTCLFFDTKSRHWTLARRREGGHFTAHSPRLGTVPEFPGGGAAAPRFLVWRTPRAEGVLVRVCRTPSRLLVATSSWFPSHWAVSFGAPVWPWGRLSAGSVTRSSKLSVRAAAPTVGFRSVLGWRPVHRGRAGGCSGREEGRGAEGDTVGAPSRRGLWRGWDLTGSGQWCQPSRARQQSTGSSRHMQEAVRVSRAGRDTGPQTALSPHVLEARTLLRLQTLCPGPAPSAGSGDRSMFCPFRLLGRPPRSGPAAQRGQSCWSRGWEPGSHQGREPGARSSA